MRREAAADFGGKRSRRENRTFRTPPFHCVFFSLLLRASLLSPTWLRITLLCASFPRGSLTFFLPPLLRGLPPTGLLLFLFRDSSSSSSRSPPPPPPPAPPSCPSSFRRSSTLVADQLHGRSYRAAMTRKWNVLSRAVIHLLHVTVPHAATQRERESWTDILSSRRDPFPRS